ncbi:hypothetical protein RB595_003861 [Gaeumannomyces hyphopodioides]
MRPRPRRITAALVPLLLLALAAAPTATAAGASAGFRTKRGLAHVGNNHESDNRLMGSNTSEISWYYTWSRNEARAVSSSSSNTLRFVPMVHSLHDASSPDLRSSLDRLPATSTHLLAFNEPDGEQHTGGSDAGPRDAARAYIDHIAPLRDGGGGGGRRWRVSHPAVTGSPRGLDWLRAFNRSCYELDRDRGCPADFVAAHWYGDQHGLRGWLAQLRDFYTDDSSAAPAGGRGAGGVGPADLKVWVTELGLPQADGAATLAMMRESLAHLDGEGWVEAYAWFGAFRAHEANAWTGDGVALFDDRGALTDVGAMYLGGEDRGFRAGMTGGAAPGRDSGAGVRGAAWLSVASAVLAAAVVAC